MRIVRREVSEMRYFIDMLLTRITMVYIYLVMPVWLIPIRWVTYVIILCYFDGVGYKMRCLERWPDADTIKKSNLDYIVWYEVWYAKGKNSQYMLDKSATGQAVLDTSPKE